MKKIILTMTLVLSLALVSSCSNDSDDDYTPPPPTNNDITYTGDVKTIIDSNCLTCHGSPTANGAPMQLVTYDNVKNAVQTRGLIGKISSGAMPPVGANLSAAQIQTIKDWQSGGFVN